jgi:hypothetical protein
LLSIEVTPSSPNVVGIGGYQQLTVTAKYSNGEALDVTDRSVYKIDLPANGAPWAPLSALAVNTTGRVQSVEGACTWTAYPNPDDPKKKNYATNPYILTATFAKHDSVAFISVASLAGCESPDTAEQNSIVYNLPEQYRKF